MVVNMIYSSKSLSTCSLTTKPLKKTCKGVVRQKKFGIEGVALNKADPVCHEHDINPSLLNR